MSTIKTDYSSLLTKLSASKLQTSNPNLYQTVSGLIGGAKAFTDFASSSFDSINGTFKSFTDALSSINNFISDLTDFVTFRFGITERQRQLPLGEWYTVAYDAALFTSATGTWTVDAVDIATHAYTLIGKTCIYTFSFSTTSIGGAGSNLLQITLPVGIVASVEMESQGYYLDTNVPTNSPFRIIILAGGSTILLARNGGTDWPLSTDAAYFLGTLIFAIK